MGDVLLLPSARLVPAELATEFGPIPSAMIPLDCRPALRYVAEPYVRQGYELVVGVHENGRSITQYLMANPDLHGSAVDVGPTSSLGETIYRSLRSLARPPGRLVVNFADTFVGDELQGPDVICCRQQEDVFRWTAFTLDERSAIREIVEKDQGKPEDSHLLVFVGVFSISDSARFMADLDAALWRSDIGCDPFYEALKQYFNRLPCNAKVYQEVSDWRDFGHLDTYSRTQRTFFLNRRFFNRITIDDTRGVLNKRSSHPEKLIDETRWYLKLPQELQHIAPRVFSYNLDPDNPTVELEFYGYPTVGDVYLFGEHNMGVWWRIFGVIGDVLDNLRSYRLEPADRSHLAEAMREMYETKTRDRLALVADDPRFGRFCHEELQINGRPAMGLRQVLQRLAGDLERLGLYTQDWFSIVHGDLCPSNILYDLRNGFIRLVDPRGRFGKFELYGDPRYDLAKLCHSFQGDYDFLLNGLFVAHWQGNDSYSLDVRLSDRHRMVKDLFLRWFTQRWAPEFKAAKVIESLLFLSMVPLHADRPAAQEAFLARGLELYSAAVGQFERAAASCL